MNRLSRVTTMLTLVLLKEISTGLAVACFECHSVDGAYGLCEDNFGPDNETEALLSQECRVGYFSFPAHFCVKIKGTKENGETLTIRTCSVDDWGSQCGNIRIDQSNSQPDIITGCLSSCETDGCNSAVKMGQLNRFTHISMMVITFTCALGVVSLNHLMCS